MLTYSDLADRVAASYSEAPKIALNDPIVRAGDDIRLVLDQRIDELLVVVPGTTDFAGWMDDFSTWPRSFAELGWYHEGFASKGIPLFNELMEYLPSAGHHMMTTYVGHSLGGALAQVLALLHTRSFFGTHRLVTFGCPRGAAAWNSLAGSYLRTARAVDRFVREGDPIPNVPFRPLYKHLERHILIGTPVSGGVPMANHSISLYASDLRGLGI